MCVCVWASGRLPGGGAPECYLPGVDTKGRESFCHQGRRQVDWEKVPPCWPHTPPHLFPLQVARAVEAARQRLEDVPGP